MRGQWVNVSSECFKAQIPGEMRKHGDRKQLRLKYNTQTQKVTCLCQMMKMIPPDVRFIHTKGLSEHEPLISGLTAAVQHMNT